MSADRDIVIMRYDISTKTGKTVVVSDLIIQSIFYLAYFRGFRSTGVQIVVVVIFTTLVPLRTDTHMPMLRVRHYY